MNKVNLIGRWCADPDVRYSQGENPTCIVRCNLAVGRKFKKDGEQSADFISCVAFGKIGELLEKYTSKGSKIGIVGRIQTNNYTNKDGVKVYSTDVIVEEIDFLDSKKSDSENTGNNAGSQQASGSDGFMSLPDGIDEELPFN